MLEAEILAALDAPKQEHETSDVAFRRKEHEIGAVFSRLTPVDSLALERRLTLSLPDDPIAVRFSRLVAARRNRLVSFLRSCAGVSRAELTLELVMGNAQLGADPFAYEIRRLSSMIIAASERSTMEVAPAAPGELAKRLSTSFDLRPLDVDIALAVLASQIDHEFEMLLHAVAGRSELGILSALLPRLEDRLCCFDAVGADAPVVACRLLRRAEVGGQGVLSATRRFRSAVFGVHLLSSLPAFAELIVTDGPGAPWVHRSPSLHGAMSKHGGAMCIVSGESGSGRTSWANKAARSVSGTALRIDAARAARADGNVSVELRELLEDSTLLSAAIVLDNAGEMLGPNSRLASLVEEVVASAPLRIFVVVDDVAAVDPRIATRALTHVQIEAPPPAVRERCGRVLAPAPRSRTRSRTISS